MDTIKITIDGLPVEVEAGTTILEAARQADIYIPSLCAHPDLPPAQDRAPVSAVFHDGRKIENARPEQPGKGCGICVVEIKGHNELVSACATPAAEGMAVTTQNERIREKRRERLLPIMARHRHACLICDQQDGCSRTTCSADVPAAERCCDLFGHCELQQVAGFVGIPDSTPRWVPTDFAVLKSAPLFERDYSLCVGCTRCVRVCRDLRGIEALGFVFDKAGQMQVGSVAKTLEDSGCKFCMACVEVCPTGALVDKAAAPASGEADRVPCIAACPAHIDVPGYLRQCARGRRDEANAIIREKVPFPGVLGRVCTHPCEAVCRRGEVNESIAICALKRYAADGDRGRWKRKHQVDDDSGKEVAVVGAGPAGLTAAFYLRKKGHGVTVFEAGAAAGGMLRYGIPQHRLPEKVIDSEIADILATGITLKTGMTLGKDVPLEALGADGFDAVFLAVGAPNSRRIALDGCNASDVIWALEFLNQVARGADIRLKATVVVVGGGSVAVDAAMTALRCGAGDVKMVCLEASDAMPASRRELESAKEEGIEILPSRGPGCVISEDGKITGLDLLECTRVFDDRGKFNPQLGRAAESIPADQLIIAAGQATDLSFLNDGSPIRVERGMIAVNPDSLETDSSGIYAGGDVTAATGTVIDAVAAGRRAAASIDQTLGGTGVIDEILFDRGPPDPFLGRDRGFAARPREILPCLDPAARVQGFEEIAMGCDDEKAMREARRCLQCDLRLHLSCNPLPPQPWLPFDAEHVQRTPASEGVFQLLDAAGQVLRIKGSANLRSDLLRTLEDGQGATRFVYEEHKMYSQRESELLQKYIRKHGRMPAGDEDDLF